MARTYTWISLLYCLHFLYSLTFILYLFLSFIFLLMSDDFWDLWHILQNPVVNQAKFSGSDRVLCSIIVVRVQNWPTNLKGILQRASHQEQVANQQISYPLCINTSLSSPYNCPFTTVIYLFFWRIVSLAILPFEATRLR